MVSTRLWLRFDLSRLEVQVNLKRHAPVCSRQRNPRQTACCLDYLIITIGNGLGTTPILRSALITAAGSGNWRT